MNKWDTALLKCDEEMAQRLAADVKRRIIRTDMNWKKIINPWQGMPGYNCFGCSKDNPFGLHLCFYEDGEDVVTTWNPSENYQGWLDIVHGGIQALILDETCGWVITRKLQTAGVTSKMETQYLHPVSVSTSGTITVRAHIREQRRSIVIVDATLTNEAGTVCTKATCTYFAFPKEKAIREMNFRSCDLEEGE